MAKEPTPAASGTAAEGRVLGRYILGHEAVDAAIELYVTAAGALSLDAQDRTTSFAIAHPWALPLLDGALALRDPAAPLRRKAVLMAAILETRPEYCDLFLSVQRPRWYVVVAGFTLLRAAVAASLGLMLLPFVR